MPDQDDVFQERLYCIRYIHSDSSEGGRNTRYYKAPTVEDLRRESMVMSLLSERFDEWQEKGYISSDVIEGGYNTDQPIRERGWQYWHQLFNPRQLLVNGLFVKSVDELANSDMEKVIGILGINKITDWNSKLCIWNVGAGTEKTQNTYTNQALNTLFNYGARALEMYKSNWFMNINPYNLRGQREVEVKDARAISIDCDVWITDPPYADAVNYHELTEFFLAWDRSLIKKTFGKWYADSKRVLAVKGTGETFNKSMIDIYTNLANHMPTNGTQVVMFTHQDVRVWAELAMILWSSGLRVVSAWNIATETESGGLKNGNYVKGTVLLVLKKQTSDDVAFQDDLYRKIKREVQFQIDSMRELDDKEDPNFTDADYLLAAYASSLKVLTAYKNIEGIDVEYELSKTRDSDESNPIEELIRKAVKIAYDYLIPEGIDALVWRDLSSEERFYIRGLELEMGNVHQISAYQELARGFGVQDYQDMFENFRANSVRLKTASEYRTRGINNDLFGRSMLRHVLSAIYQSAQAESTVEGRNYLKATYDENNEYWDRRSAMIEMLEFISRFENIAHMDHWHRDSHYARLLKEVIRNDGI